MEIQNMNLNQINTRIAELDRLVENSSDASAVNAAADEKRALIQRRSELEAIESRQRTAQQLQSGEALGRVIERGGATPSERVYGVDSPEYRTAFFKHLTGADDTFTPEERTAFVHTTANTTAPLPKETLNQIWDLVSKEHCIMDDITIYRTGTVIEVVKHTAIAAGAAATVNENAAPANDEQNTFVKVTLSGHDFAKTVKISYAMAKMSLPALEQYLINEISNELGRAMADDVVTTIISGTAAANKITGANTGAIYFPELASAFAALERVGSEVVVYANRFTIFSYLVTIADDNNTPIFQQSLQAGVDGHLLGAPVKIESSVANGKILIGDPKKFVYNMVEDIMIENDRDISNHNKIYSGYARGEGALIDDKAFALYTVKTS